MLKGHCAPKESEKFLIIRVHKIEKIRPELAA